MQFVLVAHDRPDSLALRKQVRPDHLAYLESIKRNILFGGPMIGPEGNPSGSMIVFEAADRATVDALIENDPYSKAGLFDRVEVTGFRTVVRDGSVTP